MWGISLLWVERCRMRFPRQQGPLNNVVSLRELVWTDMNSDNGSTYCQAVCYFSFQTQRKMKLYYRCLYWMWLRTDCLTDWLTCEKATPVVTLLFLPLMLRKFHFTYWLLCHVCCCRVCCNANTWTSTGAVRTQTAHLVIGSSVI
jgi:hypothetical protein